LKTNQALLLIDIQNDYFPGGRMELTGAEEAAGKAAAILSRFRESNLPVIHVAHESLREGATFFLPGTAGQKIHAFVQPLPEEKVIVKNFPNSFVNTPLQETLRKLEITHIILCGMMTHMCVDATARAAKDLGFTVTLVHDATATRDLTFAKAHVAASHVQTAFSAALSVVCDAVTDTDRILTTLE
jgi:nicotinamidase-related amidase